MHIFLFFCLFPYTHSISDFFLLDSKGKTILLDVSRVLDLWIFMYAYYVETVHVYTTSGTFVTDVQTCILVYWIFKLFNKFYCMISILRTP